MEREPKLEGTATAPCEAFGDASGVSIFRGRHWTDVTARGRMGSTAAAERGFVRGALPPGPIPGLSLPVPGLPSLAYRADACLICPRARALSRAATTTKLESPKACRLQRSTPGLAARRLSLTGRARTFWRRLPCGPTPAEVQQDIRGIRSVAPKFEAKSTLASIARAMRSVGGYWDGSKR